MTQYLSEISSLVLSNPMDFAPSPNSNWHYYTSNNFSVVADTTSGISDRVIASIGGTQSKFLVWDTPGDTSSPELLALVKLVGTLDTSRISVCCVRHSDTNSSAFEFQFGSSGTKIYAVERSNSGGNTDLANAAFTWNTNTWYWVRFRYNSNNLYCKAWALGTTEPVTPQINGVDTSSSSVSGNLVGLIFANNSILARVSWLSAGTAGQVAPYIPAQPAVPQPFNLLATLSARAGQRFAINPAKFSIDSTLTARTSFRQFITHQFSIQSKFLAPVMQIITWFSQVNFAIGTTLDVETHVHRNPPRIYPGDKYRRRYREHYADALADLLPQGMAWPRESTSILQRVVSGLTGIWGKHVEDLASQLLVQESDPRSTVILLEDWERAWGLPDKCIAEPISIYDRQVALTQKITMKGGQSRQFYLDQATKIGYKISISEFSPFMAGISMAGDTTMLDDHGDYFWQIGDPDMRFYWVVHVQSTRYTWFRAGSGQAGINHHLELALATDLECMMQRWKPAHTVVLFDYSPLITVDTSQTYNTDMLMILPM